MNYCLLFSAHFLITSIRPADYKELFNLRHAQARNVIERIFGVFKKRFQIFKAAPEYSIETQAKIVQALCVVHNFIRVHDPDDFEYEREPILDEPDDVAYGELGGAAGTSERNRASKFRDTIALSMWDDYQRLKGRRRIEVLNSVF